MTSTTGGITLFTPQYPIVIRMEDLYDPTVTPAVGKISPVVGCLVVDVVNNNTVYVVDAVDPNTHISTLSPARMLVSNTNPVDSLVSVISYGNDIFRIYYDLRTLPITVRPDTRIVVFGTDVASYQLVQNPGPSQVVLSRHYDASGNYTGPLAPMAPVISPTGDTYQGASYATPCSVQSALTDGQEIFMEVFNSQGAQIALISAFAKQSIIINEMISPEPIITSAAITSTQSRPNNEIYIYENQTVASLGLQVVLTYSNGYTRTAPIDQTQCFLYGTEDFIPSYPGLRQTLLAKYYLDTNEVMSSSLAADNVSYVTAEADLVVIANGLVAGVKIAAIPIWSPSSNKYKLAYFLYTTTRDRVINVTGMVTLSPSTPFNGAYYGQPQVLTLQLDMSQAEPTIYSVSTIYQQTVVITLQPLAAVDRYVIKDATNAPLSLGATTSTLHRPTIHYDPSIQQYYVPSLFASSIPFLQAFYWNANPPYDTTTETQAPSPTHFQLRDPSSGVLLTAAPIAISAYETAVSIMGAGLPNRYAQSGSNLLVEFLEVLSPSNTLILYGIACDTYTGTYNG